MQSSVNEGQIRRSAKSAVSGSTSKNSNRNETIFAPEGRERGAVSVLPPAVSLQRSNEPVMVSYPQLGRIGKNATAGIRTYDTAEVPYVPGSAASNALDGASPSRETAARRRTNRELQSVFTCSSFRSDSPNA